MTPGSGPTPVLAKESSSEFSDSGVAPEHPSFRNSGRVPLPPAKWKGASEFGPSVCNDKLISAKSFVKGHNAIRQHEQYSDTVTQGPQPYDENGHRTHVASTAASMFTGNVDIEGLPKGAAAGMAPYAHVAVYKVCRKEGCAESDILAGMDAAAADGVDIIYISVGDVNKPFYNDTIAVGAFGATQKGILVVGAAGNSSPSPATLSNEAPWILTIGASTMDRKIRTTVTLGNRAHFYGESISQPNGFPPTVLPLVYPGSKSSRAKFCASGLLSGIDVKGKVVVRDVAGCVDRVLKGAVVKKAGGAAMILTNSSRTRTHYSRGCACSSHVLWKLLGRISNQIVYQIN